MQGIDRLALKRSTQVVDLTLKNVEAWMSVLVSLAIGLQAIVTPPPAIPDTPEQIQSRLVRHMAEDRAVLRLMYVGMTASACAAAALQAQRTGRSDLVYVISRRCGGSPSR